MMRPRFRAKTRTALTLIELVVSALLASMMLTALTSIVWSSARETVQLRKAAAGEFPITQLTQQMRTDFVNARGMAIDAGGVTLHGFLGSDPVTGQAMLTPATVRYEIDSFAGRRVLMRVAGETREPVWVGCRTLQIESLEIVDPENEWLPQPGAGGLPNVPSRFRLTIVGDQNQLLWREVIEHHEG